VKSRGQDFESGEHTLRITQEKGLEVFRRVQAPVRARSESAQFECKAIDDRGCGGGRSNWGKNILDSSVRFCYYLLVRNPTMSEPTTLQEAIIYYSDPDNCLRKLVSKRWADGVVICPTCGSAQRKIQ